jgi:hypothetical protein
MTETICSVTDNETSAQQAKNQGLSLAYAPIRVSILDSTNGTIRFLAKGSPLVRVVEWSSPKLLLKCPTSVATPEGQPIINTNGTLYVNKDVWNQTLDPITRSFSPGLKWPENLGFAAAAAVAASPFYHDVEISVSSARIEAHVAGRPGLLTFDLRDAGSPEQALDLNAVITTLVVKHHDIEKTESLQMQVLHAYVHGTCLRTQIHQTIDLMNPALADPTQVARFSGKLPTLLRLSSVGLGMFGIGGHP